MENSQNLGVFGEGMACAYLLEKGWKIVAKNHKEGSDELDIIAKSEDETLVFVEVKTRRILGNLQGIKGEDNATSFKLMKISRACQKFVGRNPCLVNPERGWRIDLLAVDVGFGDTVRDIRHYENI